MPKGTDIGSGNPEIVANTLLAATGEHVPLGANGTIRVDKVAGAVAGVAVAAAFAGVEKGNVWIYPDQPEAGALNDALGLMTTLHEQ